MVRRQTELRLASINSTKMLVINSNETLYTLSSGNRALEITNRGTQILLYGQSSVIVNSGGLIYGGGSKFWDSVTGDFTLYLAINSIGVTTNVSAQEYGGN